MNKTCGCTKNQKCYIHKVEKVEQEPTCDCLCRGCDIGCSKCFWKGTNKFVCQPKTEDQIVLGKNGHYDCNNPKCPNFPHKPKTEGRELVTKWLDLNKPYYKKQNMKITGSPKQDTWAERFDDEFVWLSKFGVPPSGESTDVLIAEATPDAIKDFIRSELQNQRQEIIEKIKKYEGYTAKEIAEIILDELDKE